MIKHIVLFKLKDSFTADERTEALKKVKRNFESLIEKIQEIHFYEVGINISESPKAWDVAINSEFKSLEDLKKYSDHPAHRKAVEYNSQFSQDRVVVDYEF